MPVHKIEWSNTQSGWALWHITESIEELMKLSLPEVCPEDITSTVKQMEWAAIRILVRQFIEIAGLKYKGLNKDEFGKPSLNYHSHHISLSHSYPFVAAQINLQYPVGIDVEQPKAKILRIAQRVFTPGEVIDAGQDIVKNCIYWCAKEALYKIYGKRGLSFYENLEIQPFELGFEGDLNGIITIDKGRDTVGLRYLVDEEFVLVRTRRN